MAVQVEVFDLLPDKLEYWPGETMTGKVVLKVKNGSLKSQGIYLNLKGGATVGILDQQVHHTRRRSSNRVFASRSHTDVRTQSYTNAENYLYTGSYLVGDGQSELGLGEGELIYPFSIPLPSRLVSSYVRNAGPLRYHMTDSKGNACVSYYLQLGMKMLGRADLVVSKIISMHTIVDLNLVPEASQAGEAEQSKTFWNCSFCFFGSQSGPLTLKVKIPRRGYLPRETIPFEVELQNQSNRMIKGLSAQLIEVAMLKAQGRVQNMITVIPGGILKGQLQQPIGEDEYWKGELVVPPEGTVYPSKLGGGCGIIDLDYYLKVIAHVEGCCNLNLEAQTNIIIGTCRSASRTSNLS